MVKRLGGMFVASVLGLALVCGARNGFTQEATVDDFRQLGFAAQRSFEHMLQLWKDQRFTELYEFGTFATQADISPEAFERLMLQATRTLQCCWLTLQRIESRVVAPDTVHVKGRLGFKNKGFLVVRGKERYIAREFAEEETLTFVIRWEEQRWRLDLFRVLALSGVSPELLGPAFYFRRPY